MTALYISAQAVDTLALEGTLGPVADTPGVEHMLAALGSLVPYEVDRVADKVAVHIAVHTGAPADMAEGLESGKSVLGKLVPESAVLVHPSTVNR